MVLVSRNFSDRIERLTAFSQRVAEGDFRAQASDATGDALDVLSDSLNQTAARLDRTIRTLTEERNLSSAILGSMVEGVLVVNAAERVVFANHSFAEILGLGVPPQAGSGLVEWVRQTELIEAVRKVLAGEPRVESEIVTGTLRQHFFAATVAPRFARRERMAQSSCSTTSRICESWSACAEISSRTFRTNSAPR